MGFAKPNVIVLENNTPSVFPERLEVYGERKVTSPERKELLGLAKKVWENDKKVHPIYSISLEDVEKSRVRNKVSFSGVSVAYRLYHDT
jgi:hypothetical protein